ncbi:MAG: hypothetical protein ACJA2Q_000798 [Pseudohongiellaceae bacterium]|jgi:hypothetical protein
MKSEEYSERLQPLFGDRPMNIDYEIVAGSDKVAVIAEIDPIIFVQA